MPEEKYFWYIPANNEIVQEHGPFSCTGFFESRSAAIEYIQQVELSKPPDDVYLMEAGIHEREDAAVHVGFEWNDDDEERETDRGETVHGGSHSDSTADDKDSLPENEVRYQDWEPKTSAENIDFLLTQSESGDIDIRRDFLSNLQPQLADDDSAFGRDTAAELCLALTEDRSGWDWRCKTAANEIIADISESYPDLIEEIFETLLSDLDEALSKQVENHPGYGLVKLPAYGRPAATGLAHYATWRGSAPQPLIETVANPGRIKRADFLIFPIVDGYPDFIEELHDYGRANPNAARTIYRLIGVVAGSDYESADQAWELLSNDLQSADDLLLHPILTGIRRASLSNPDRVGDITLFIDILRNRPRSKRVQREISRILSRAVEEQPDRVDDLWEHLTSEGGFHNTDKAAIATALADTLGDEEQDLPTSEQLRDVLRSNRVDVTPAFTSLLATVANENPSHVEPIVPELLDVLRSTEYQAIRVNVLEALLPVAKSSPETVTTGDIIPLIEDDSSEVRKYACDIVSYAGPADSFNVLQEIKRNDPSEQVQHTASHALARLEARYPKQFATED